MQEHLGGHVADFFARELGIPHQPRASAEVERNGALTVVHGQHKAIALNASLVAERLQQRLANGNGGVLDGVMLVDPCVAFHLHGKVNARVTAKLVEHVVEKAYAGAYVAASAAIEVNLDVNRCFVSHTADVRRAASATQIIGNAAPRCCHQRHVIGKCGCGNVGFSLYRIGCQQNAFCAQVASQLHVGEAVANHIAARQIIVARRVFAQQCGSGLACRLIFVLKSDIDYDIVERDAFAGKCFQHQFVRTHECLGREAVGAKSVLIGHHNQLIIKFLGNECKVANHARHKFHFLERVELIIYRWLNHQCAVAVDEQRPFGRFVIFHIRQVL